MKISTEIDSAAKLVGEEKTVELVARAGFDAWDFSMFRMASFDSEAKVFNFTDHPLHSGDYVSFAKKLRKIGEDNGIRCNQAHAPFPVYVKEVYDYIKRAIECTAIAGGEICVIHPDNFKSAEENAEMYFELLPFAKEHGVKIATENMWCWDNEKGHACRAACSSHTDFLAHINAVNDPSFVACLDLGHAEMRGLDTSAKDMILTLGDKLQALHIHDNDLLHDSHQLPFSMDMDFDVIVKALKQIDYKGYFTLESGEYLSDYTPDNILVGIKKMADVAKKLAQMFENS